jgi:RNA binding exosome subunit
LRGGARRRLKLEVSVHAHATEDEGLILRSLEDALGISGDELTISRVSGSHGNPVTIIRAELSDERALEVLRGALRRMDPSERIALGRAVGDLMDDRGRIYLRLDKQSLVLGEVRIGREDPVRLVLSSSAGGRDAAELLEEALREAGG